MSEHVALFVDRLVASTAAHGGDSSLSVAVGRSSFSGKKAPPFNSKWIPNPKLSSSTPGKAEGELHRSSSKSSILDGILSNTEDASKNYLVSVPVAAAECRICQEEDDIINLESPCACTGSLKFVHRKCLQHWCNEKGDIVCEICHKPYEGGYMAPPSSARADSSFTTGSWEGQRSNLHEPRLFSVASEHHLLDLDYEDYTRANVRSAACFRAVACMVQICSLLLLTSNTTTGITTNLSHFVDYDNIMSFCRQGVACCLQKPGLWGPAIRVPPLHLASFAEPYLQMLLMLNIVGAHERKGVSFSKGKMLVF